ncbi:MAG: methyltransferase domain-containing protein [Limnospira sp. PMC 1240.20]|uniref:class I SAM-dependent methyltransferase n=1 Tax=unclassified Limnospira TaxID=2642885 RepID=UPI0028E14A20|nr:MULTISPECIES: methyltransferase [unclassified Limnospira]MDT9189367.1 methyltransferase domain-containing protein [Limnospira sp. PMC 894.15]MDT9209748.1 methyltransferase domain-containing protein [Limnospira sp. PMC 1252.20]MDT9214976.1 methyltransferase domain-containing protein [Limnospira sp. PMC 1256.20]MDT9220158.1 methyltransferase domain-containing protein [Limnospira sp. PMC 1240.20]MDT9235278.1 methyltransferase domain-containing protein [Limnospira sp. PMC 917.15]
MKTNIFVNDNPLVDALIQTLARSPQTFRREIMAIDEMYSYVFNQLDDKNSHRALTYYYTIGRAILDTVKQFVDWHFGGFDAVESFLDFACGYGRFTRFLIEEIPPERIWVSDIYKKAVQFQSEYLGVQGIVSASVPEDYQVDRDFDLIMATSFFSHMPATTFERWMQKLYDLKSKRGLLLFSVLDMELLPPHIPRSETGLVFSPDSESQSLDKQEYGTTWVTEEYVRRILDSISDGNAEITRIPKGLNRYQDLYAVSDRSRSVASPHPLTFYHHPEGKIDYCYIQPNGEVRLSGWAIDLNPGVTVEVQLWSDSRLIGVYPCSEERPDIVAHYQQPDFLLSGWSCVLSSDQISPQDILIIKIVSSKGLQAIIEGDRLVAISSRRNWEIKLSAARQQLSQTQAQLTATVDQYNQQIAQYQSQIDQYESQKSEWEHLKSQMQIMGHQLDTLENRIQAMESSKFWKLRTKWFKLKRVLGLPVNE